MYTMAPSTPVEVVQALLQNPTDNTHVASLVAPDATYQSLSFAESNPVLTKILPYVSCAISTIIFGSALHHVLPHKILIPLYVQPY
jgi:hypothetical protein